VDWSAKNIKKNVYLMNLNRYKKLILVTFCLLAVSTVLVVATERNNKAPIVNDSVECTPEQNPQQCWETMISGTLKNLGLDQAFEVLSELYSTEPAFAADCHSYVHLLGQAAYDEFSKGKKINLTPKSSYCGYGFYHGFMETLLWSGDSIETAKSFCKQAGVQLAEQTTDAEGACYHGIGHGAIDGSDPRYWGDPEAMIKPGMDLCRAVSPDPRLLYRCVTGVYNSIEILSQDPKYKLTMMIDDPVYLCPSQPEEFQEGCYSNMIPAILRVTVGDYKKSLAIVESIKEAGGSSKIKQSVVEGTIYEYVRANLKEPGVILTDGLALCRSLAENLRLSCVRGLSGGYMKYGEPEREYVAALDFCQKAALNATERNTCYESVLSRLRIWYSSAKSEEICGLVPKQYQGLCIN